MGICIGLLGESQSMRLEDWANLLRDAVAIASNAVTNEYARLLRITDCDWRGCRGRALLPGSW